MKKLLLILLLSLTLSANNGLNIHKIRNNVYAIVGDLTNRTPENFGNNSTHGVIITPDGVILIDSGASFKGAQALEKTIQTITNKKIKIVINSGGQDHRWLGNDYFKKQGAKIFASEIAVLDQKNRGESQLQKLKILAKEKSMIGTIPVYASNTFSEKLNLSFGGVDLELYTKGTAHTPGDSFIWLKKHKIMFTGDIVYTNRMLGVGSQSDYKSWVNVFEEMAKFKPTFIIPGHGNPCSLKTATKDTYNYLKFLEKEVTKILDEDGEMLDLSKINHSKFDYLFNSDIISKKNAQRVFTSLQF